MTLIVAFSIWRRAEGVFGHCRMVTRHNGDLMLRLLCGLYLAVTLITGCSVAAPTGSAPASAPAPTVAAPSPAANPASPVASPAVAPSPSQAASRAASPAASLPSVAGSPSPGAAVNAGLLFTGPPTSGFVLQSSAFANGGELPKQFSCDDPSGGQTPPLSWSGAPASARAYALIDQDPDAGGQGSAFTHWLVYNIPANVTQLDAAQPALPTLPNGALQGQNGRRVVGYMGACPPAGAPPHHYTFQLFALDGQLALQPGAAISELQIALNGHIVGQTELVALFGH
jgi:Raf kinase inhibitor-like YbhB/YbcL family protein